MKFQKDLYMMSEQLSPTEISKLINQGAMIKPKSISTGYFNISIDTMGYLYFIINTNIDINKKRLSFIL